MKIQRRTPALVAGAVALSVAGAAPLLILARGTTPVAGADAAAPANCAASTRPAAPEPPRPTRRRSYNVLLLTVDTLRADLGFAGYPRPVSPSIDAFAARSIVFERGYALASYTAKSVGPMLIGRYASETHRDADHFVTFFPANVFVAERARDAGVRTFAGMSHVSFKWKTGLDQGFETWDTSAVPDGQTLDDATVTSDRMTDLARELLSRPENVGPFDAGTPEEPRRFFAWFHYFDPHLPYARHAAAPRFESPEAGPRLRDLYDGEVWYTDREVGRLLEFVRMQPWSEETAILLTSDHGEAFGEHDAWGHGRELWEPLVRVPLLVHVPGAAPRRVAAKRSLIDVAPTILDLLGVPGDERGELRGASLVPDAFLAPEEAAPERDVYIDMPSGPFNDARRAFITGPSPGMKLIALGDQRYSLFDLQADPDEANDLSGDRERLAPVLDAYRSLRSGLREIPAVTRD